MIKTLSLITGIFISMALFAQDVACAEYFIDSDPGFGQAIPIENLNSGNDITISLNIAEELSPGFHNIGFRSKAANVWSQTNFTTLFVLRDTVHNPIKKIEYFWLSDPGINDPATPDSALDQPVVLLNDAKIAVDVSEDLLIGNNMLFMRVMDSVGAWSHTQLVGDIYVCSSSYLNIITETAWCEYLSPAGNVYNKTGVYREFINSGQQCDSSYLIDLTIESVDTSVYEEKGTLFAIEAEADEYQWIDCNSNSSIPDANGYTFSPDESGNYAVIITKDDCTDTSFCHQVTIGGIADNETTKLLVFPNPNKGNFRIEFDQPISSTIEIKNNLGSLILSRTINNKNKLEFNLDVPAGIYILTIKNDKSLLTSRFIVE